jgi:hypothetical protein
MNIDHVEFSLSNCFSYQFLKIVVLSDDGWSWALAWRQLGVEQVCFFTMSNRAKAQLDSLSLSIGGLKSVSCIPDKTEVFSAHIASLNQIWINFFEKLYISLQMRIVCSSSRSSLKGVSAYLEKYVIFTLKHQELRHRRLGGLTLARLHLIWGGHGSQDHFGPGTRRLANRSLTMFLEPMAKFARRKGNKDQLDEFVWRPYTENVPFPWPIPPFPLWVETKSLFHGGTVEISEFTRAELGQLFDLRPELADNISQ